MSERLTREVARLGVRLAEFLAQAFPAPEPSLAQGFGFLKSAMGVGETPVDGEEGVEALDRLSRRFHFTREEVDLVLLAGMAEEHEGYAAVLRSLHPRSEPRPVAGLAAQIFGRDNRHAMFHWLTSCAVVRSGIVRFTGDAPFFERTLEPADGLWPVLHGCDVWPSSLPYSKERVSLHGLEHWLETPAVARASRAIQQERPCTVLVTADSEETAFQRGLAIAAASGREPAAFHLAGAMDADRLRTLKLHVVARGKVAVLRLVPGGEGQMGIEAPDFEEFPDAVVFCARAGVSAVRGARPLIAVFAERLSPEARRRIWSQTVPQLRSSATWLAARYPIEPGVAASAALDLDCLAAVEQRAPTVEDVADVVRSRGALLLGGGVKLIRPQASWEQLVLPRDREQQLRAAIDRLDLQVRVLDEWGFLKGRAGARGVRMLFSGPPGTGKTLAAEVLAGALKVDLLFVDISRVVSKWIGETEKNLSAVFDAAERAQAVLFFDEADALFGRRTEVSDAHDRYANLETAYLLARLERFEGLAILATNLRQNIDPAFLRRMEFVVDFDEPDREERFRLWRCHIPDETLLDPEVNLYELASLYPVVGGFIRNAAVAAAFLAASDGGKLTRAHFVRSLRREYEKAGKAFPGMPAGMKQR